MKFTTFWESVSSFGRLSTNFSIRFPRCFRIPFLMGDLELERFIIRVVLFYVVGDRLSHKVETIVFGDAIPLFVGEAFGDSTSLFDVEASGVSITVLNNIGEEGVISFFLSFLGYDWSVSQPSRLNFKSDYFSLPGWLL